MIQEIPYKYDPAYKDKKPELIYYIMNTSYAFKGKEGYRIPAFQDLLF